MLSGGIIFLLLLGACDSGSDNKLIINPVVPPAPKPVENQQLKLHAAQNCDSLRNYVTESLIKQYASIPRYIQYYYCPAPVPSGGGSGGEGVLAPAPGSDAATNNSSVPDDVSDTNNQEAGVNEADIVKTDLAGNIYLVSGRHFIIAQGFPPTNMNELSRIDLGGRGLNLFLDRANQRATVLARYDVPYYIADAVPSLAEEQQSAIYPQPDYDYTVALFYDVSTPSQPVLLRQLRLQGYYREGRRINDRLHLVSNHHIRPMNLFSSDEFNVAYQNFNNAVYQARCNNAGNSIENDPLVVETKNQLINVITGIVNSTNPQDYLPKAQEMIEGSLVDVPYLACTDVNFPEINMSLGLQIISSVNTDGSNLQATSIVNNSYITYASENNLYLAEMSRSWWWQWDDGSWPTSQTAIYKFSISGNAPQYISTGRVDGYVNNQFSFSEFNGNLRVATTQDDMVADDQNVLQRALTNNVFVLSDGGNSDDLNVIGEVRGFAPGETIRSSRFFGDKGFVVTFRNVDPLFTFDLSDPVNPSMQGELIIPGFSTYIHQYDENHLLTIGRSAGEGGTGIGNGLQLQLIDVSNMQNPVVVHTHVPAMPDGWSWSSAQYDHKAFTFYKPANLLAIPVQIYPWASDSYFSGIIAYSVALDSGFEEKGRVDHKDLAYEYYCNQGPQLLPIYDNYCSNGWYMEWAAPRRSIVMTGNSDVYLYTMSDVGIKASSINSLSDTLGHLIFPLQPYPWWYFGPYPVGVVDPLPMAGGVVAGSAEPVVF